jgi:hypothetical protein
LVFINIKCDRILKRPAEGKLISAFVFVESSLPNGDHIIKTPVLVSNKYI